MLTLNTIKSPKGSRKNTKRLGRGQGSGQGQQAGKGHKGQKARKSGHVRLGFEGNNLPLYMRLPKYRTFTNAAFKTEIAEIDLAVISDKFSAGEEVTVQSLCKKGILKGQRRSMPVKVLSGAKKVEKSLMFVGIEKFSKSARENILKSGGEIK